MAQGGQAAGLTRLTETIAEGACATVTLGWSNYAGYRVTLHEQSVARSERVFLASVAIVRYMFRSWPLCVSAICSFCRRTPWFMLEAQFHVFLCDPFRRKFRDVYRRHLVVPLCVVALCSLFAFIVATASFNYATSFLESFGYSALSPFIK